MGLLEEDLLFPFPLEVYGLFVAPFVDDMDLLLACPVDELLYPLVYELPAAVGCEYPVLCWA